MATEARAVEYELPDTDGQIQSLDQYKGKWVIVNYWATWCGSCMEELPELVDFHKNNELDAVVVGINFETIERNRLTKFVADNSIPFKVLSTEPVERTPLGPVPALPTTYIINPDGKVVAGEIGIVTRENLETYISLQKG
jgi:peroxiredoxin